MTATPPDPCAPDAARAELEARIIERMLEVGLRRLDKIEQQYEAAATDEAFAAADLAYTSITRSLRLTLAYDKRRKDAAARRERETQAEAQAAATARAERGRARKLSVRSGVGSVLLERDLSEGDYERLRDAADDWLDALPDDDFADPPVGRMLARLCQDLGVPLNLEGLLGHAWARDEVYTRPPGSPFTALRRRHAHDPAAPVFWKPAPEPEEEPEATCAAGDSAKPP